MELAGRLAVVTGASSGIGEVAVHALARAGMRVVAVARRGDRLEQLAATVRGVVAHPADVTDSAAVGELALRAAALGGTALLVNNAGAGYGRRFDGPDDVDGVVAALDVNFLGVVRCTAAFADQLRASAPSCVINVASVAGKVAVGSPGYSASKFAVVGFTEAIGASWAARGVRVAQLNPGFVATEGFPQTDLLANPLTRRLVARPEVVAEAIVALARSDRVEMTVPRWYRPLVVARHVAAPVFRAAARRVAP